jgi:hypothetical protein
VYSWRVSLEGKKGKGLAYDGARILFRCDNHNLFAMKIASIVKMSTVQMLLLICTTR